MDLTIFPTKLCGTVKAIPSKSQAHRLLICSAFSDKETFLECPQTNEDIVATARCLSALGANITRTESGYSVTPIQTIPTIVKMDCGESGSTLRFMLPIVCALGVCATFVLHGRLPKRPLSPLWEELERMGCHLSRPSENTILTSGKLHPGNYVISGSVSSQFISGLLFATALLDGTSTITITDHLESKPYVDMTRRSLLEFGVQTDHFQITGSYPFHSPCRIPVEGDWSNSAFFLVANALGNQISVTNLNNKSSQGDRVIADILSSYADFDQISGADIPDLIPILAILYGTKKKILFKDIGRLRLKESDRISTVCEMMQRLGSKAVASDSSLSIEPGNYRSCVIDANGDHRIAMSAAIAATVANGPVTVLGADCVAKSYPDFWNVYRELGGKYEQYLR